jgi:hypothetical protein
VPLTRAGHGLHARLLKAVIGFNQQLRTGMTTEDLATLRVLLLRLRDNVRERAET